MGSTNMETWGNPVPLSVSSDGNGLVNGYLSSDVRILHVYVTLGTPQMKLFKLSSISFSMAINA